MAKASSENINEQISKLISKINEQNPFLVVSIAAGVILVLFYFIFFQAKIKETTALGAEIGNLSQSLDQTKSDLQRINQYNQELDNLRKKIENFNKKVKSKDEIPVALESLSRLASDNGVKIEQMMPDEARSEIILSNAEGNFVAIPVVIGARSGYHDFGKFVNKLEDSGIFLGVSDFGVMTNSADSNQHMVKLVLRLVIFEKVEKSDKPERKKGRVIK